jgi:hypothetical protein
MIQLPLDGWFCLASLRRIDPGAPEWASRLLEVDAPARVGGFVDA